MIENVTKEERARREAVKSAFAAVLKTQEGKRAIFWVLEQCGLYHDGFSKDPAVASYLQGRRSIGLKLLAQMDQIDPRLYPQFMLDTAELKAMELAAKPKSTGENVE